MKIAITDHAADRFCFRIDRTKTNHEAIAILTAAVPTSAVLQNRSIRGDELREVKDPACLLVCKRENDELIVVTVIGRDEKPTPEVRALVESFKSKHLSMATNVTVQAAVSKKAPKDEVALRKYIDDKILYELDVRIYAFIAAQERRDAVYAAHAVSAANKSVSSVTNQQRNVELALLKDERSRRFGRERSDGYDAMVKDLIPSLQKLAETNDEAKAILLRCFEHVPTLAGLLRRTGSEEVVRDDYQ